MGEQGSQSTARLALWLTFAALVLIVIVFHSKITNIEFGSEGVKASMGMAASKDVQSMSDEQRKQSEQELTARAQSLQQEAKQSEPDVATVPARNAALRSSVEVPQQQPPQFTIPNLAGFWRGSDGIPYRIDQQGNALAVTEFDATGSYMTAYAVGYITGPTFSLRVATLANTQGVVTLTMTNDRLMSGQYVDAVTGMTIPMQWSR